MTFWQRTKRFSRSVMVLAISCLVLEQVLYSVVVPGYFRGVLVSPVFWGVFSGVCFYLLWRLDSDFVKEIFTVEDPPSAEEFYSRSDFMSPNYSPSYRRLVRGY
ncbi:hypothetical protein [Endozoicomonas sp. 4G]|uniref:hypothetical protein n=1 Tax=Endozoicomonas sp. 4G TaxID=2872754 RepID=UPI002078F7C5|nr:hypothetical protein [Endozoicomonas sp. 4G]